MVKVTLNIENFENLKNGTFKGNLQTTKAIQTVGAVTTGLLGLVALADNKIGKTAKLLKELIRIFSN